MNDAVIKDIAQTITRAAQTCFYVRLKDSPSRSPEFEEEYEEWIVREINRIIKKHEDQRIN